MEKEIKWRAVELAGVHRTALVSNRSRFLTLQNKPVLTFITEQNRRSAIQKEREGLARDFKTFVITKRESPLFSSYQAANEWAAKNFENFYLRSE